MMTAIVPFYTTLAVLGCTPSQVASSSIKTSSTSTVTTAITTETTKAVRSVPAPTYLPSVSRLVGIGDVHGDVSAARAALQIAGVIDADSNWIGGETVVVQVGDQLDRGDDEQEILELFEQLSDEAFSAGGGFYPLIGNHEAMNVELDFRYVTEGGWLDFAEFDNGDPKLKKYPKEERGRVVAFSPAGPMATFLAGHNTIQVVGDTMFVHGGVLPQYVEYGLEKVNAEVNSWMAGKSEFPYYLDDDNSPVWSREFSDEPDADDCALLDETLKAASVARMVVAHTIQDEGITNACDSKVWRVDVGMSAHYGGTPQALEITASGVTILK